MSDKSTFQRQDQRGQTLLAALVLSFILAIFGYTLMKLVMYQMKVTVETKRKDRLFSGADAAMQRTIAMMASTQTAGVFNDVGQIAGYGSLTATGTQFTDIPGIQYWIKVVNNDRSDPNNISGTATDTAVDDWQRNGDEKLDHTIFVRVKDTQSGKEDTFYNTLHRNDIVYTPGGEGIATTGCMDLGQTWDGDSYNSCHGAYGAARPNGKYNYSNPINGDVPNGSVHSKCIINGSGTFTLTRNNTAFAQPPDPSYYYALETNYQPTIAAVPNPLMLPDITGNTTVGAIGISQSGTPAPWPSFWGGGAYRINNVSTSGNPTINMDVSRGFVHIYAFGTVNLSGGVALKVIQPTSVVTIDDFNTADRYNTSLQNIAGFSSYGYPVVTGVTSTVASNRLAVTTSNASFYWSSALCSSDPGQVFNALGYRIVAFDVIPTDASDTFDVSLAYWNSSTASEMAATAHVAFTDTNPTTKNIPFSDFLGLPAGLTFIPETAMRRITFSNFNLHGTPPASIYFDNLQIRRYGGPFCCATADAVLYGYNSNNVTLSGTGEYQCLLYFPNSDVIVSGGGHGFFSGAIVSKSFQNNGGGAGAFHYDQCLSQNEADIYMAPPIITSKWRQVGRKY